MSLYRFFLLILLCSFVAGTVPAFGTEIGVVPKLGFSEGDIKSWVTQLQTILPPHISKSYVVTLNCDLPEIIVPYSVTNVVTRSVYEKTLASFKNQITVTHDKSSEFPPQFWSLGNAVGFINDAFSSQSTISSNIIAIRLFPPYLQFELYTRDEANATGLLPFVIGPRPNRVKIESLVERGMYLVLAPPELHYEFRRLARELSPSQADIRAWEEKRSRFVTHQRRLFESYAFALTAEISCYKLTLMEPFHRKSLSESRQNTVPQKISEELKQILSEQNCVDEEFEKLIYRKRELGLKEFHERKKMLEHCGYDVEGLGTDFLLKEAESVSVFLSAAFQDQVNAAVNLTIEEEMLKKRWSQHWSDTVKAEGLEMSTETATLQSEEASGTGDKPTKPHDGKTLSATEIHDPFWFDPRDTHELMPAGGDPWAPLEKNKEQASENETD